MKTNQSWLFRMVLCLMVLVLAACASTTTGANEGGEPVFQPDPSTNPEDRQTAVAGAGETSVESAPRETVDMGSAVLYYARSGGLKGIRSNDSQWHFYADGRITSSDGREWQVPAAEVQKLVDDVLAQGFTGFEASYIPADTCCDRVTHTIALQQEGRVDTVSVLDAADAPAELFQAVDIVNEFLLALPVQ